MKAAIKKIGSSIQLWSMFGPLLVACMMMIMLIRSTSMQWEMPLIALSGIVICYLWSWRGFAVASTVIVSIAVLRVVSAQEGEGIWISVLALSILSSLIATILFLDKSNAILTALKDQHQVHHAESFLHRQEELKASAAQFEEELQVLNSRFASVQQQLANAVEQLVSQDKRAAIMQEELVVAHERSEDLLQELYDSRQKCVILEQQVETLQEKLVEGQCVNNDPSINQLKVVLSSRECEIINLKAQLEILQEDEQMARQQSESYVLELVEIQDRQQAQEVSLIKSQDEQILQQGVIKELHVRIEALSKDKQILQAALSSIQSELKVISNKEQQKLNLIEEHAATIQASQTIIDDYVRQLQVEKQRAQIFFDDQERKFQIEKIKLHALNEDLERDVQREMQNSQKLIAARDLELLEKQTAQQMVAAADQELQREKQTAQALIAALDLKLQREQENAQQLVAAGDQELQREKQKTQSLIAALDLELQLEKEKAQELTAARDLELLEQENAQQLVAALDLALQLEKEKTQKLIAARDLELLEKENAQQLVAAGDQELQREKQKAQVLIAALDLELQIEKQNVEGLEKNLKALENLTVPLNNSSNVEPDKEEKASNRELRRQEGLYNQLRSQFAEKTRVLDDTRRVLFYTEEKLAVLEKNIDEFALYGGNSDEEYIYGVLSILEQEMVSKEKNSLVEISGLEKIISSLIHQQ